MNRQLMKKFKTAKQNELPLILAALAEEHYHHAYFQHYCNTGRHCSERVLSWDWLCMTRKRHFLGAENEFYRIASWIIYPHVMLLTGIAWWSSLQADSTLFVLYLIMKKLAVKQKGADGVSLQMSPAHCFDGWTDKRILPEHWRKVLWSALTGACLSA